jgi:hypothetical protein
MLKQFFLSLCKNECAQELHLVQWQALVNCDPAITNQLDTHPPDTTIDRAFLKKLMGGKFHHVHISLLLNCTQAS